MDIVSFGLASKVSKAIEALIGNSKLTIPSGTTAERPTLGVGDKAIRFNTDISRLEEWDGTEWKNISATISAFAIKGTDTAANILAMVGMVAEDLWIASDTLDGYVYDGTTWINIGPLQGPQGVQGIQGIQGVPGKGISTVIRTSGDGSAGTIDTYTITYTDATTSTFNVQNGADGDTIDHISKTAGTGASGTTDTYTVWGDLGETMSLGTFSVYNGANGTGTVASVVAGTNVTVDATDPANPIINVAAVGSEHYDQEAEPIAGSTGATWYVPSTGILYKYVNDGVSDIWIDISTAGAGAGVEEAPIDGFTYARQNSSWVYTQEVPQTTQPIISIATSVNERSDTVGTITNYDADATYYISAINGTITYTTGSIFTYTSVDITNGVNASDTISVYTTKAGEVQSLTTEQAMIIVYVPVVADTTIQVVDFTSEAQYNDGWSLI